jgi:BlaI family transcriptional regulator, penicillinase repressor
MSSSLSRREREIIEVLYELGNEASAEEIREKLSDPPTSSAVRAMLGRLEEKGALRHKEKGLRYIYSAITPRSAARRSALRRLVRVFFGGRSGDAVTALLEQEEEWSPAELDELSQRIQKLKKEKGS